MRASDSGKGGALIRLGLMATVFVSAIALTLPAQAARHTSHPKPTHTAPAHTVKTHTAKTSHAAKPRQATAKASPRHAKPVRVASVRSGARHSVAQHGKTHATPTAKARLRAQPVHGRRAVSHSKSGKAHYATASYGGISCVPFARAASGIELKGNATNWWDAAEGIYARGARPEVGSVLNFRSTGKMRLGHVAVVARVINSREVEIDHANWAGPGARKGLVSRGIPVIDVSRNNDWTAVRVGLGRGDAFGSVYPTYGFIYDRPDRGMMVANTLAPAHGGISPVRSARAALEVAEAPAHGRGSVNTLSAPTRALR